jgi:undecaprenyl-diphosphatase
MKAAPPPSRRPEEWREDHVGARDLTRWPTRLGRRAASVAVAAATLLRDRLDASRLPYVVLIVTAAAGLTLAGAMTAVSTEIYEDVAERDGVAGLDRPVLDQMVAWRSPGLDDAVTGFTHLGGAIWMPVLTVVAVALLCWWWRSATPALLVATAAAGSVLLTVAGKYLVGRARPDLALAVPPYEGSPSFPSGHSLNSWVIALVIAYLVAVRTDRRPVAVVAIVACTGFAVAMGLSRVYLGHHWLTDVLVAWTLGTGWLLIVVTGHRLALTVRRSLREPEPDDPP